MNCLVTYYSVSGNTKKLAEAVFDVLPGSRQILEMSDVRDAGDFDVVFAGFPIHEFGPARPAKKLFCEILHNKKVALFATHAMPKGSPFFERQMEPCRSMIGDNTLLGFYSCRGELSASAAEKMIHTQDEILKKFGAMREQTIGHPDREEIAEAEEFANRIIETLRGIAVP